MSITAGIQNLMNDEQLIRLDLSAQAAAAGKRWDYNFCYAGFMAAVVNAPISPDEIRRAWPNKELIVFEQPGGAVLGIDTTQVYSFLARPVQTYDGHGRHTI